MEFARALLPTDLSDYAFSLETCAALYVRMGIQEMHLLHVREERPDRRTRADSRRRLKTLARTFEKAGLGVESQKEEGDPALAILAKARALRPDLIIIGSHGKGFLKRFLLGSVSLKVVHHWHGPILVERFPQEEEGAGRLRLVSERRLDNVLLAGRDLRPDSHGLALLLRLRSAGVGNSILFTSLEISDLAKPYVLDQIPLLRADVLKKLRQAAAPLLELGMAVDLHVEVGHVLPALLEFVRDHQTDLVVLELRGADDPWQSIVARAVLHLGCSTLVLPEIEE